MNVNHFGDVQEAILQFEQIQNFKIAIILDFNEQLFRRALHIFFIISNWGNPDMSGLGIERILVKRYFH